MTAVNRLFVFNLNPTKKKASQHGCRANAGYAEHMPFLLLSTFYARIRPGGRYMSSLSRLQAKKNLRAIMSYENWSKEDLIARLTLLEAEKELLPQHRTPTTPPPPNPRRLWKTFDFSSHPRRKIALKFCYSGWAYNGLAIFLSASVYMTRQTQAQAVPPPRPPETLARVSPNQVPLQELGLHRQLRRREQSLKSGARQRGPRARRGRIQR
ncbi:hypothetical protein DFH08DRAFT_805180 [Mycena albidolilacea]|uniref:Uncharacterized protein n=1 Tax=Mycena albidolilacea TaxID=1033008 RepID=A0AAD7AAW3_9AGAR|nr:hypothetical protein DFH08DRAFT_805180 [Mycena albidolilacea]